MNRSGPQPSEVWASLNDSGVGKEVIDQPMPGTVWGCLPPAGSGPHHETSSSRFLVWLLYQCCGSTLVKHILLFFSLSLLKMLFCMTWNIHQSHSGFVQVNKPAQSQIERRCGKIICLGSWEAPCPMQCHCFWIHLWSDAWAALSVSKKPPSASWISSYLVESSNFCLGKISRCANDSVSFVQIQTQISGLQMSQTSASSF